MTSQKGHVAIIGTRGYPSYYGGFETAIRRIAPYLSDRGWKVTVYGRPGAIRRADPATDPRVESILTRGVEKKSLSTLSFGWSATHHAVRSRPDVALVMNVANGFFLPKLRRAGVATVVNVDGMEWERDKWGQLARRVFRRGAALTAQHADELIYDSREIQSRWLDLFGVGGTYIPYGGEPSASMLELEPGLNTGEYVLAVARLVPENTVQEFLDAARTLATRTKVVLVGSSGYGGILEQAARSLAAENTNFIWTGHISDDRRLSALWQHAGVYFHGHSVGGTNPALVHAMSLGAPTVALDTPFNREVLGNSGAYVESDSNQIETTISSLLASKERTSLMRTSAMTRAANEFTWSKVCAAYDQVLMRAIDRLAIGDREGCDR